MTRRPSPIPLLLGLLPILPAACRPVSFDLDRPITLRASGPEVPESFMASLRTALSWLGGAEGRGEVFQGIEVRFAPDLTVDGRRVDGGVDRLRNDVLLISRSGVALPPRDLRALAAHELGHVLGAAHLPECAGVNVMALGCSPEAEGYSTEDIAEVCAQTSGGTCGRRD